MIHLYKYILASSEYRYLLLLALGNLGVCLFAFNRGYDSKNPAYTEQSFDCFMHASILSFMLYAGITAKQDTISIKSPYGLQKLQTLSGLTMCLYILMIGIIHLMRSLHHLFEHSNSLLSLLAISSKPTESETPLICNYIRILLSLFGMYQFIQYALFVSVRDLDEGHQKFLQTYKELIGHDSNHIQYESHFTKMHAVFLFFLCDVMLNVGQIIEYMLGTVIEFHAMGLIVIVINMLVIYIFVKPLLTQTVYQLLMALDCDEEYKPLQNQLSFIEGVTKVQIKAWGTANKKTREAVVQLETLNSELIPQIRLDAQQLCSDQFLNVWLDIQCDE